MANRDANMANQEEESNGVSDAETRNPRSRRNATASEPAAYTRGVRLSVVRARGLQLAADVEEDSSRSAAE